jgi:uncharacterized membrane protein
MPSNALPRLILAAIGATVAIIFALRVRRERACGEDGTCLYVASTPQAKTLGISNTGVGIAFYVVTMALEILRLSGSSMPAQVWIVAETMVWIAAMGSFYLLYQLYVVLRRSCPLCLTAHVINFMIAATYIAPK